MMRPATLLAFVLPLLCGTGAPAQDGAPTRQQGLSEDEKIVHLLNRFTPGVTASLVEEVRREGIEAWFRRQLEGGLEEPEAFTSLLKRFETLELSSEEIFREYNKRIPKDATRQEKREAKRRQNLPAAEALSWVILRAVYSRHAVREVTSDFFRNHFAVSIDKGQVRMLIVDWEREVIHNQALGNFGEMLEASAKHPAMLFFLDNHLSRRPATPEELRRIEDRMRRGNRSEERAQRALDIARQRGLNENYARELLELHTLGVDNYYTQEDVINVAKCLTGWTIRRGGRSRFTFLFQARMHSPGDKPFLDGVIDADEENPLAEGEEVLKRLIGHEGTAHFLAWKLCRWFVNDEPDGEMVERIAKVFQETRGDLPKVLTAIVQDPEFFNPRNARTKFKRPWEFVISALRATGARVEAPGRVLRSLTSMNESLYRCADPTGYYDQAEAWRDPGALAVRWAFANELANGKVRGARIPRSLYSDLPVDKPQSWKKILADQILPATELGEATSAAIDKLVKDRPRRGRRGHPARIGPQIVAILLGSPEFQRQ